jgi:hypothetical protein
LPITFEKHKPYKHIGDVMYVLYINYNPRLSRIEIFIFVHYYKTNIFKVKLVILVRKPTLFQQAPLITKIMAGPELFGFDRV